MPEGPEIRQAADKIARVLEGQEIIAATLDHPALEGAETFILGHQVERVDCHGKALLTHLSSGKTIYSHNQLYGVWLIAEKGTIPETNRVLRLGLHTQRHSALLYSATDIELWNTSDIHLHPFLQKLGPDVLAQTTTVESVMHQLEKFKNRQLASIYLDQGFIAGLGNYLRSEILFFAGVHPALKPKQLTVSQRRKLAKTTLQVSQRSYKTGGRTLPRGRGPVRESNRFAVFARASKPCLVCRTKVQKTIMNSRRIYFCPTCQPKGDQVAYVVPAYR